MKVLKSNRKFHQPSDMVTLPDGRLVIRDNLGLQLFDEEGNFLKAIIPKGVYGRCFGVASDGRGHILTINTNPKGSYDCITKKGETDILLIDFENNIILEKIKLVDIIPNQEKSACRFLQCDGKKVYVVDLGLDIVYILSMGKTRAKCFGQSGKLPGQWLDPAGLAVDSVGNMIVADACNNRLQIFDKHRKYLGFVKLSTHIRRPSGIYLDIETKSLYVLNLKGESLVKVALVEH